MIHEKMSVSTISTWICKNTDTCTLNLKLTFTWSTKKCPCSKKIVSAGFGVDERAPSHTTATSLFPY